MSTNHYVYIIYNTDNYRYYIGVRSCHCDIFDDKYMGSSSIQDKNYIQKKTKHYNKETRLKISKAHQKIRKITDLYTNVIEIISITEFIKKYPNLELNSNTMRKAAQKHHIYKNVL